MKRFNIKWTERTLYSGIIEAEDEMDAQDNYLNARDITKIKTEFEKVIDIDEIQ